MAGTTRAVISVVLAIAQCTTIACATAPPSSSAEGTHVEDELRSVERERLRALVAADIPTLERLHADDFQAISPLGSAFARDEYLRLVASGDLDYVRWEPEDIRVRAHRAVAAIRYRASADVVFRGTLLPTMKTWNTAVYEQRKGRWVIVWFQVTQITPPPR